MIGIVDYEAGNLTSVKNALQKISAEFLVSADPKALSACTGVILPGVGAARSAMQSLDTRGLVPFLRECRRPFLGICLGMHLLYEQSDEGNTECLGIIPGRIRKLDAAKQRVPHMGWNHVSFGDNDTRTGYYYFAHSYYAPISAATIAVTEGASPFAAAVRKNNYLGVQFHPEKSGGPGLSILQEFIDQCK